MQPRSDSTELSTGCFCDINKAFDHVWHKGPIYKLKRAGINGLLLDWLSDILQIGNKELSFQGEDLIGSLSELVYLKDLISAHYYFYYT